MSSGMDDYYAPHPRLLLGEPLLLVGQVGAGTSLVARAIAARTGLPFVDVDRNVENSAGCSLPELVGRDGIAALATHSAAALERAFARRPCAVIAGGSAPLKPEAMRLARENGRVVYLRRPAEALLQRIRAQLAGQPGSLYEFALATPATAEELAPLLEAQAPGLEGADVVLECGDRPAGAIAGELIEALDRIVETRPLGR